MAGIARTLRILALTAILQGDSDRGITLGKEGLALGFGPNPTTKTTKALVAIGSAAWYQGDFAQAEEFFAKAVTLSREQDNQFVLAASLNGLGLVAHYRGEYSRAETLYEECLSIARRIGAQQHIANTNINLAHMALSQGNLSRAPAGLAEGLRLFREMNDKEGISEGLEGMARLASMNEQLVRAVRLFAAASALRERYDLPLPNFVHTLYEHTLESLRCRITKEDFTEAWQAGRIMSIERAVDYALELDPVPLSDVPSASR